MKPKPLPPLVVPVPGEIMRFTVQSRSRPHSVQHTVDLEYYDWSGGCSCEAFQFNFAPKLERGAKPSDDLRCIHLKRARSYFLDEILPRIADQLNTKTAPPPPLAAAKEAVTALAPGDLMRLRQWMQGGMR